MALYLKLVLFLGLAWVGLGLAILSGLLSGPWAQIPLGDGSFSAGWLALGLGLYNLVRWYHRQGMLQTRQWQRDQVAHRDKLLDETKRQP